MAKTMKSQKLRIQMLAGESLNQCPSGLFSGYVDFSYIYLLRGGLSSVELYLPDPFPLFRYIELKNSLKVLLVSDPTTKTSGAALDIKIGSFHDPVHLQGLAHLCEHVLFTGSELFPNESYSAFLGQRGGTSNAFTTSEHTNFHFEVPCEHFIDALIRFVSFIQCPILRESSIQNELEIIQRSQSFTYLMADLRQDIKIHLSGALMEHTLQGIAPLRYWYINPNEKSKKYKPSLPS